MSVQEERKCLEALRAAAIAGFQAAAVFAAGAAIPVAPGRGWLLELG